MSKQTILVTGATRGIGFEAVRLLSERLPAATILLGCRSIESGQNAIVKLQQASTSFPYSNIHPIVIDVSKDASIDAAVKTVKDTYGSLDVLINNAAIIGRPSEGGAEQAFDTNVFGVYKTMEAFLPLLPVGKSKVIVVASEVGAWMLHAMNPELQTIFLNFESITVDKINELVEDWKKNVADQPTKYTWPVTQYSFVPYEVTKTMIMSLTRRWSKEHSPAVHTVMVCPGYCATDLNEHRGFRTPTQGAESILFPVFNDTANGGFYRDGQAYNFVTPRPEGY